MLGGMNYLQQLLCILLIAFVLHYLNPTHLHWPFGSRKHKALEKPQINEITGRTSCYEAASLAREIGELDDRVRALEARNADLLEAVQSRLDAALDELHSDQLGKFDFANEYAGAAVLSTPETAPYPTRHSLRLFGALRWAPGSDPAYVIRPRNLPGECFAFHGGRARVQIRLGRAVVVTHCSLEHPRLGRDDFAPKRFQLFGLGAVLEPLGNFSYNRFGRVVQTFEVRATNRSFAAVELRILDNYGNKDYTCLYRFRVHSVFG